jgi:hypothetical protein
MAKSVNYFKGRRETITWRTVTLLGFPSSCTTSWLWLRSVRRSLAESSRKFSLSTKTVELAAFCFCVSRCGVSLFRSIARLARLASSLRLVVRMILGLPSPVGQRQRHRSPSVAYTDDYEWFNQLLGRSLKSQTRLRPFLPMPATSSISGT